MKQNTIPIYIISSLFNKIKNNYNTYIYNDLKSKLKKYPFDFGYFKHNTFLDNILS